MENKKVRGRSRKRRRGYYAIEKARKVLASALCMTLVSGNVMGSAVAFASEAEPTSEEYRIYAADLEEAVKEAVSSGSPITAEQLGLEFKTEEEVDQEKYDRLFEADGNLYEIDPEYSQAEDMDGMDLRMFVRIPEGAADSDYEMNGREELIFLFMNGTDTKLSVSLNVDGYISDSISVQAYDSVFGEKGISAAPAVNGGLGAAQPEESSPEESSAEESSSAESDLEESGSAESNLEESNTAENGAENGSAGENVSEGSSSAESSSEESSAEESDSKENSSAEDSSEAGTLEESTSGEGSSEGSTSGENSSEEIGSEENAAGDT